MAVDAGVNLSSGNTIFNGPVSGLIKDIFGSTNLSAGASLNLEALGKMGEVGSIELGVGSNRINTITNKRTMSLGAGLGTPIQVNGGISIDTYVGRLDQIVSTFLPIFRLKNPY